MGRKTGMTAQTKIGSLPTPSLLLDRARLAHNAARMRAQAAGLGVSIRPHLKTAKSLDAAAFVLGSPPGPATVSTLKEAEMFGAAGITDLLYAVCISPQKLPKVTALSRRGIDLKIILDSVEAAEAVAAHAKQSGDALPVLIEIDVDDHRSGVRWNNRDTLIRIGRLLADGSATLQGVMCHSGESYNLHDAGALAAAVIGLFVLGVALDRLGIAALYRRDHLDQVLATFGVVLFANEAMRMVFGSAPLYMDTPPALSSSVRIGSFDYPAYRGAIIVAGVLVAVALHLLIDRTRLGMLIRAGASNRSMVSALGVNIGWLNSFVFALGAALAGLAGAMVGPILSIQPGMGEPILILTLVVIVIGGIGSIRGALLGALIVGIVDTLGRGVLPGVLHMILAPSVAAAAGPAVASVGVYLLMVVVLAFKPDGLFPGRSA